MLREEVQTCLKEQRSLSAFSITAVITIIGFTVQMDNTIPGLFLLPYIVLLIAAIKECNYRRSMVTIVAYMINQLETADGFQWESSMNKYRINAGFYKRPKRTSAQVTEGITGTKKIIEQQEAGKRDNPRLGDRLSRFLETQEYALMAVICLALFVFYSFPQLKMGTNRLLIYGGIALAVVMTILLILISRDYWNLDPAQIASQQKLWKQILEEEKGEASANEKSREFSLVSKKSGQTRFSVLFKTNRKSSPKG